MTAAIILTVAGILIKYGKKYYLIAGYNTMPKERKAKYDISRIASLMGNVLFAMALLIMIGYVMAAWLEKPQIEIISLYTAVFIGVPYILIKANSPSYKLNNDKTE